MIFILFIIRNNSASGGWSLERKQPRYLLPFADEYLLKFFRLLMSITGRRLVVEVYRTAKDLLIPPYSRTQLIGSHSSNRSVEVVVFNDSSDVG